MLYGIVAASYSLANILLGVTIVLKSRQNLLSKFYLFCVSCLVTMAVATFFWSKYPGTPFRYPLEVVVVFLYALFPFFFLHFVVLFVRRYEILRSKQVIFAIYFVGLFSYTMILLELIPQPLSVSTGISQGAYIFFLTWMTIFFAVGVAMLYEVARGFYEKAGRSNVLFICFVLLLLVLPGPFTESVFFRIFHVGNEWYYISCTLALVVAVYFIFRHKIIVNTLYDSLKTALSVLNDIFLTTNDQFQIEMVRGVAVSELLGYNEQDLIGRPFSDIIDRADYLAEYRDLIYRKKMKECYFDTDVLTKDGRRVAMNFSIAPMYVNDEVMGFVSIGRDMQERKQLEQELRQAQKMESLGTLAGGIAHDFNNILQIIIMNIASLERRDLAPEKLSQIIDITHKAVARGSGLVEQILTFARKTEVKLESVDLNGILHDLSKMLREMFPERITFELDLAPQLPSVVGDQSQITQVVMNLCVNARDAMPDGGRLVFGTTLADGALLKRKFPRALGDQYICLSVADDGMGMTEDIRSRIFEPFYTTKEKGKGTGLGLSVVYGIVDSHRGFIDVVSSPGKGTKFHIYFPSTPAQQEIPKAIRPAAQGARGTETLLVVENEEMLLGALVAILEQQGYRVIAARDGEEGVEKFRTHAREISLVLTDLGLPKLDGWGVLSAIQAVNPSVRTLVMSGYLDPRQKAEKSAEGVGGFILKPYKPQDLVKLIRKMLDTVPVPART
jgi:PAS domain S-box-containing protein